jgi:hypothetical protein
MKAILRNSIYYSLIICYVLVATVGNIIVLKEVLNSGDKQHQFTPEKKSREIPASPVWTVKKHILPILQTDISSHLGSFDGIFVFKISPRIHLYTDFQSKYTYLECLPSKPRDPPLT